MSEAVAGGADALVIEPRTALRGLGLIELWRYRELLYFLVWRDVKVRYKQTMLGGVWVLLQPLATAAIFALLFGRLARVASDGVPYYPFAYAGLVVWTLFQQGVQLASVSLVNSSSLITKVYFPRAVVPISSVLAGLVDFAVAAAGLLVVAAASGLEPGWRLLLVPPLVALAIVAAAGVGLGLAALSVAYRDVRHAVPFLMQLWFFLTPVIYPSSHVAPVLAARGLPVWFFGLNPLTGIVEAFRWAVLGTPAPLWSTLAASAAAAVAALVAGSLYFRSVERSFADVV
jgi:lipopolysaccharide transport system permease protein